MSTKVLFILKRREDYSHKHHSAIRHDVPVILDSMSKEDTPEGDPESTRSIVWTLNFTMRGYLFSHVTSVGIIQKATANVYNSTAQDVQCTNVVSGDGIYKVGMSTGLYNSARFMNDMLNDLGISSAIEVVIDNNDIDRMVTKYRPKFVIIEALWVVPQKFQILKKLHPNVTWIIRLHSEMPFMAMEGIAMDWIGEYAKIDKMFVACNAPRMMSDLETFINPNKLLYLPNYYPQQYHKKPFDTNKDYIDIACFGAVRPLKNHLVQAFAALYFAKSKNKKLRFHINSGRIEQRGDSVLNNLIGLFQHLSDEGHELINHKWAPREEFLKTCAQMDIGLQCNFSETFNIVSADLLSQGVPIVGSSEIPWSSFMFNANATDIKSISDKLSLAYSMPKLNVNLNQHNLTKYTNKTKKIWYKVFGGKHGKKISK